MLRTLYLDSEAEVRATAGAAFATVVGLKGGSLKGEEGAATRLEPSPSSGAEGKKIAIGVEVGVAITLALPNPEAGVNATAGDTFASDVTDAGLAVGVSVSSCGPPSRAGAVERRDGVEAATEGITSADPSDNAVTGEIQNASIITSTATSTTGLPS